MCFQVKCSRTLVPACKLWTGREPLCTDDPEIDNLIKLEKERQTRGLELIASEVKSHLSPHLCMKHNIICTKTKLYLYIAISNLEFSKKKKETHIFG